MKVKYFILSVIAAVFLSSAIPGNRNLSIGSTAPEIQTLSGNSIFDNNNQNNIVVNFWSPKNPTSRILNKRLSDRYSQADFNTEFISICIDNESLMDEILRIDSISEGKHFASTEINPRSLKDYNAEKTFGAYLISKEGKIISLNP